MPISGLILTLAKDASLADQALGDLAGDARFALGQRKGPRQPVTLTTDDSAQDKACWQWLQAHRGIDFVDVACVFFDEEERPLESAPALAPETNPTSNPTRSRSW